MVLRAAVLDCRRSFPEEDNEDDAVGGLAAPGRGKGIWGYASLPPTCSFHLRGTSCRAGAGGQRSQVHPGLFPGLFPRQAEGAGSSSQSPPPGEGGWVCQADGGQGLWP